MQGNPWPSELELDDECPDATAPLFSCVVRFMVKPKAGEALEKAEVSLAKKYSNRPYLLVVSSQDVQLFATGQAEFARGNEGEEGGDEARPVWKEDLPSFISKAMRLGPVSTAAVEASFMGAQRLARMVTLRVGKRRPDEAAPAAPASGDELPPGAVSTLGLALTQIVDVRQTGAMIHVAFRRQHPSTRFADKAERLLMSWAHSRSKDPDHDPLLRCCVLSASDEAAASELVAVLQAARQRLAAAVQWVARGLPLHDAPAATLVTVQPSAADAAALAAVAGAEVLAAMPAWGAPIAVPQRWMGQATAAPDGPSIAVWLSTPLGPACARLSMRQLVQAFFEGPHLVVADAAPLQVPGCAAPAPAAGQLQVQVQASMQQQESQPADAPAVAPAQAAQTATVANAGLQELPVVGVVGVAVLAAWLQLLTSGWAAGMAFLACNAAAGLLLWLLTQKRRQASAASGAAGGGGAWTLTLLQASLVSGTSRVAAEAGVAGKTQGDGEVEQHRLPQSFRHLVAKHPDILDENMAERFITTWPSPNKAYVALQECVEWRRKEGLVGLLDQPHPKFELIKRCYPHAVLGWSRKKDCLVTLDSYGIWKQSYEALKAQGVTDDELLRHLMLVFDFYFKRLDTRLLPHGRSINIIDLGGLKMSDAAGEAFRFISKVGALLNLHYPARLSKAFLIRAPSWWSIVWRLVSPLIDSKTRERMDLYSCKDMEGAARAMLEWIDADVLPKDYGGTSTTGLYDSELEQQFWAHVGSRNSGAQHAAAQGPSRAAAAACGEAPAASPPSSPPRSSL